MWVTISQAVGFLNVTERTLWRWVRAGRLQSRHQDGRTLVYVAPSPDIEPDTPDRGPDTPHPEPDRPDIEPDTLHALVVRHEHELAALAHRLGQAQRTAPRWAKVNLAAAAALLIAALVTIATGYQMVVDGQGRALVAETRHQLVADRLADVEDQLNAARDAADAHLADARSEAEDLQNRLAEAQGELTEVRSAHLTTVEQLTAVVSRNLPPPTQLAEAPEQGRGATSQPTITAASQPTAEIAAHIDRDSALR